jgi:hypothetical protein
MQELANPGTFSKSREFGHEETADMFHGRAGGAVGQRPDRTLSPRSLFLVILED